MSKVIQINWMYILLGYFCLFGLGFLDTVRGPYLPDITEDLALNDIAGSMFFVMSSLVTFVTGIKTAQAVHYIGLLNVVRLGLALAAVGSLIVSQAENFTHLMFGCVGFGLGFGAINVAQNLLILRGATLERRRQLFSGLHSVYALAAILAPVAVSIFYSFQLTWRDGFLWAGIFCAFAILFSFFAEEEKSSKLVTELASVKVREAYWPTLQLSFYVVAELLISTRIVLLLRRENQLSLEAAPQILSLFFGLLLAGRLVFMALPFKNWSNQQVIKAALLSSIVVFVVGLVWTPYVLVLCGLTMSPVFGVSMDLISEIYQERADRALATCLAWSGLFIVFMHFAVGVITEFYGIYMAMWCGPLFLGLSLVALNKIRPSGVPR